MNTVPFALSTHLVIFESKKGEKELGTFLCFGIDYEELSSGIGHYSTAIIQKADGSVITRDARGIKFAVTETAE